jgi:hypothetical protein
MKPAVAVALIVCGTVLILAPYVSSAIGDAMLFSLTKAVSHDVSYTNHLPEHYDTFCYIAGLAMIVTGTVGALGRKT